MGFKRVGLLTGGGDVPGVNSAIKMIVTTLEPQGVEILGLRRGWAGLINVDTSDPRSRAKWVMSLNRQIVRTIDRFGGTILHSSRVNPEIVPAERVPLHLQNKGIVGETGLVDLTASAIEVVQRLELDCLIAIGGDGTLSFARRLHKEGIPVIAIPKTMDNDVYGTDYCIGFSTAVSRSVQFINDLRTVAGSHERFLVVELFGRYSGETCLLASYLASTDRAIIAEVPFDAERLYELLSEDRRANPSNYAIVAVSEGAHPVGGRLISSGAPDESGNPKLGGIGNYITDYLEERSDERVIYQRIAYLMRSGAPDSLDQLVANNYGVLAANLVTSGESGKMVSLVNGRYAAVPVDIIGQGIKRVDVANFYDSSEYRPHVANVMDLPMFLH